MPLKKIKTDEPYQALAFIYNYVMRHVNYADWADYIDKLCKHFDHSVSDVLEMACGVGTFTSFLAEHGYKILAVDSSEMMLKIAREMNQSQDITFKVGDMRSFQTSRKFDLVLCLYDSVNYLITPEDLEHALHTMGNCLKPNGLFIFDVTTVKNSLMYFNGTEEVEETPDFCYIRRSHYMKGDHLQTNDFTIFLKDGEVYRRYHEKHRQRIYTYNDVRQAIRKAGLQLEGRFHEFTLNPPERNSLRIHYVVRKPQD